MLQTRIEPHAQKSSAALELPAGNRHKEQLEILLCEKVQAGEDIASCIQALQYFNWKDRTSDQLQKVWSDVSKERSAFNSLQRVIITAFALLGMIAFFNGAFKQSARSGANTPPVPAIENQK